MAVPAIRKLDPLVVNRIAAGEIIQRPCNALKELLENAVDAQATSIDVVVKDGGLKMLQITDNGTGIHRDDMPILCERFTTSKLREFNDLTSIATYGFRGEALASITHISHVTVTTKTDHTPCAYKAHYSDGVLIPNKPGGSAEPQPVAGKRGTQITAEDMFYNVPARKRALAKPSEEYAKIIDVINRYAIHCQGVAFSCKRHGESTTSVSTMNKSTTVDNIRQLYGPAIAAELLALDLTNDEYKFSAKGLVTNANYGVKKIVFLLFVNNRSVESTNIRRQVEALYAIHLPKDKHPFVYLSIQIDPARIDVNVHPTKREVNILDEDNITDIICDAIAKRLMEVDSSRTFYTQTLLPGAPLDAAISSEKLRRNLVNPATLMRVDSRTQKITNLLEPTRKADGQQAPQEKLVGRERTHIRLASVKQLRGEVRDELHEDLTAIFTEHVFVGVVDLERRLAAIQHLTKLYLVDYGAVSSELFYQIGLTEFGNFGTIKLNPPLSIKDLLQIAVQNYEHKRELEQAKFEPITDERIDAMAALLLSRREMLEEYFSFEITQDGLLATLPMLMKGYTPALSKLPNFILRIATHIEWTVEKDCFEGFLTELALFYIPEVIVSAAKHDTSPAETTHSPISADPREAAAERQIEQVLFPAMKRRLIGTRKMAKNRWVVQIAHLPELYKIFERC
ncbi:DNA mismatch repair protein [Protomyces lactucae-debilis]|uniref:DNA mismatch repair protein n=1 Tax=Protomyces lactucae-debilis TaxID=2754530 RepID=A0A1Y2F3Q4_PROLT|nr:DNA mismatch repair protein [Protomyces lactucae-debilis]ORY78124.1 DNA mismatch repair protein [Protomyces lactucae-debilis]